MKFYGNQEDDLPLDDFPPNALPPNDWSTGYFEKRIKYAQTNMGTRTAFFYGNQIPSLVE